MPPETLTERARLSATSAAARSGVRVRELASTASSLACEAFLCEVWQTGTDRPPIAADVIKAITDAGSYVAGAFDDDVDENRLLGACIGLWGPPGRPHMHSHVAGVHSSVRGRELGFALKLDQRANALEHGVSAITWTFDPLIARNAHFNLQKLGGKADRYLVNHYGHLSDGLNGDDESDRLLVQWDLLDDRVRALCDAGTRSGPVATTPRAALQADDERPVHRSLTDSTVVVMVPSDIELLRAEQPALAREWRLAVRDTLGEMLADGAHVIGFDRSASGYVVSRRDA